MSKNIVGLDIGSQGVRAVELSGATSAHPTVVACHAVDLPLGAVSRGEVIEANTVATALKRLWSEGGFKTRDVVLGVGNHRVLARDLTVPRVSPKRLREALPFQIQDMLPVPVADALLDFYPLRESDGENGPEVHGLLIAAVKEAVLANVRAAQLAGLNPVNVDLIPFALSRMRMAGPDTAGTVAVVDIGADTTTVVIETAGIPQFVRIVPTGSGDLTKTLRSRLDIDPEIAEYTKRSLGLAAEGYPAEHEKAVVVMYEVTGELLASVRNTLTYYGKSRQADPVAQIVLTGGGSALVGLTAALSGITRLPVTFGDPSHQVSLGRKVGPEQLDHRNPASAVALGLAYGGVA